MGEKLHNWDFVGRCYDVLQVDPLNIEAGDKFPLAFLMDEFDDVWDGSYTKPKSTDHMPATGGKHDSTTVSLSSSYDFHSFNKVDGSIAISDPTGELFGTSLSASYEHTRNATESQNQLVTYTSQTVNVYRLAMRSDKEAVKVSPELAAAVAGLPTTDGTDAYAGFVRRFGTHYAHGVLFGGRVHQRITVREADYSSFLEEGLNVQAEANLTFEIAKGTVRAGIEDKRSAKFVSATKNSSESIVYAGGTPQQMFDMWAQSVEEKPAPIQIELRPIYELLTADLFPDEPTIALKSELLRAEIDKYVTSSGDDARATILQFGDQLDLHLVAKGPQRYLSAASPSYARTSPSSNPEAPALDDALQWVIVHADDPSRQAAVQVGDFVALRSVRTGRYLDAQGGADANYERGDGLTAPTSTSSSAPAARWKVTLADYRARKDIVDGDYIRFQSQWRNADGELGFLLGEANSQDPAQRVYAFGKASVTRGTIWRVSRRTKPG